MSQENLRKETCRDELQYIGLRIAYFRKMQNMTQAQLAEKVHISKNYLSHIESGSSNKAISLPLLIEISKALNIALSVLVDLDDFNSSRDKVRQQFDEIKIMFEEMKQLNEDLDKMMAEMDKINFEP
ncbi:MAG: helix-turn-helix transcriptional regulator [Selenomonadaceae bacterium]|nr:helix-turn-helix transcriptional regulator [Selenomonadaceae bacterium]